MANSKENQDRMIRVLERIADALNRIASRMP